MQVLTLFAALSTAITHRVCLSVAVVDMTASDNGDGQQRFDWLPTEKSTVLGSFLWGYMLSQVAGGALSSRGGATRILAAAVCLSGVLTALLPLAATTGGWAAVAALRVATGVSQCVYPTSYTLLGRWVPLAERSRAGALILASQPVGNVVAMASSGWLVYAWGWPSVFYVFGGVGLLAAVMVLVLSEDSPESHPRISREERKYIVQAINGGSQPQDKQPVPWRSMLTSVPLLSLLVAHLGYLWGYWVLIACSPSYINNLMDVGIEWNGLLSSAPQVAMMIFSLLFGWLGDLIQSRQLLSTATNRKIFNTIGMCGPGLMCILIALFGSSNPPLALSVLSVYGGLISATFAGSLINYVDLSPNFSGVAFAFGNMIGAFGSAFAPYAEGFFVDRKDPMPGWSNVFYLTAVAFFLLNAAWCIWGSAEVQPWNSPRAAMDTDYLGKAKTSANQTEAGSDRGPVAEQRIKK